MSLACTRRRRVRNGLVLIALKRLRKKLRDREAAVCIGYRVGSGRLECTAKR
jgi:hypothetical protein